MLSRGGAVTISPMNLFLELNLRHGVSSRDWRRPEHPIIIRYDRGRCPSRRPATAAKTDP